MRRVDLIVTDSRLSEAVNRISTEMRVAVDIESNGFFRYQERVCLIQLATAQAVYLVDPLAVGDVRPLGELFSDRSVEKIFHDADYDLRSLDRDWGFRVNNLFDTQISAAFVGSSQLGLQAVVREYAGVELDKSRKLQRSDWSLRPLSSEALTYAANDVLYLLKVRDALWGRLKELSRLGWAEEEFARLEGLRHTAKDRAMAFLAMKGSGDLDGKALAVLRSLQQFREREARRLDRPPFKVLPNSALIQLSSHPESDLSSVKGLGRYSRPPADRGLRAAINEGLSSPPLDRQKHKPTGERPDPDERGRIEARLRSLKNWRDRLGSELQVDSALLWPTASLTRLARHPGDLGAELDSPEVRNWQKGEFGEALRGVLATFN